MSFSYLFGLALMALASYLDNVRGPLFPLICRSLDLNYGHASWLFTAGNLAAVGVSFWLLSATKKVDERPLAMRALLLAAMAIFASLLVTNFAGLVAFAALLGAAINATGALSNLWTLRHSRPEELGRRLCGLHMLYGFASMLGPIVVDGVLRFTPSWRWPFFVALPFVPLMAWLLHRDHSVGRAIAAEKPQVGGRVPSVADRVWLVGTLCVFVAAEVFTSAWLVAFLVGARGMTVEQAAPYLAGFFFFMGASRALCFWRLDESREPFALCAALLLAATASILGHRVNPIFFVFVGLMGPFFPIYMARASRRYPSSAKQITQHLLLGMQATLAVGHWLVGLAADRFGIDNAYRAPAVGILLVLVSFLVIERRAAQAARVAVRS